jgi:hypothetical protein
VKARRTTKISLETDETFTIRRGTNSPRVPCPICGPLSVMVTCDEAAILYRVGVRDLCREIDAGHLHFHETEAGAVLVCLHSLDIAASLASSNSTLQINRIINQIKENPL